MNAFYFKFVSNARTDQQKPRLRLGFEKFGRTSPCPLQKNYIFYHFEFVVCFAPLSHEVERNIILNLSTTAASMKSKLESGDTPTRRVFLCEDPHSSVVGAVYVHVLRTLMTHG